MQAKECGAKTRNGKLCRNAAMENGRCRMHGGVSLKGAEHPNFKHGYYSPYAEQSIAEKMDNFDVGDVTSLVGELSLMRALLASYLEKYKDSVLMNDALSAINMLADTIRKITDSIVKQKNDTTLTAAEVAFIVARIPDLVMKYLDDPDKQQQFIAELFGIAGGGRTSAPALTTGAAIEID